MKNQNVIESVFNNPAARKATRLGHQKACEELDRKFRAGGPFDEGDPNHPMYSQANSVDAVDILDNNSEKFEVGQYRYGIKSTRFSSVRFGNCEICNRPATEVFYQVEQRFYRFASLPASQFGSSGWTNLDCCNLFGHERCLIRRRRGRMVAKMTEEFDQWEYSVYSGSIAVAA